MNYLTECKDKIVAVTGHRPKKLGGYTDEALERLYRFARQIVSTAQPRLVLTGMAQGWDQAVATACAQLEIPFDAYAPFEGQESMWPRRSQEEYWELLKLANSVTTVCRGEYAAWKMQRRNEAMVDNCEKLLTLWDGSAGGTANCINYVQNPNKIVPLWNEWVRFNSED